MSERKFTEEHVWVEDNGDGTISAGITEFAEEQLGDLVFVEMPEVGRQIKQGDAVSVLESVKAASDFHAPVDGEILEVNEALDDEPDLINDDAMEAWIMKVKLSDASQLDGLMNEQAYQACIEE